MAGGGQVHSVEVLAVPPKQKFRGLEDAVLFAAHSKDSQVTTGISKLAKPGQISRYIGMASKSVSTTAKLEVVSDQTVLFSHGEPSASLDGNSGATGMLVSEGEKDESAIPVCTVHIGVSGDNGVGGTLKNGTPAHLLVSEGVAAGKSDLINHLLHQITFRPHQSGLHATALKLPLSQKIAAVGVAQAVGISSSDRHELLGFMPDE